MKTKVLFVCLGNICRSPAAEGVFLDLIRKKQISDQFHVDSAGTSGFHAGEKADRRMRDKAKERGVSLESLSRKFLESDFKDFDFIICMDGQNFKNVKRLDPSGQYRHKVFMMVEFCSRFKIHEVPDPYYGNEDGFGHVLDIVEDASEGLLKYILDENRKK